MKKFFLLIAPVIALLPISAFSQPKLHPFFNGLSEQQVRSEFADYEAQGKKCADDEAKGRKCTPVSFSTEQPLNIPLEGQRGVDVLTFRASILTPRSLVRSLGYKFGTVARQRTPADREDFLSRLVVRSKDAAKEIVIVIKLASRSDWSTSLPELSFALVNEAGAKIWSRSQPDFECSERDIICQVGLAESGNAVSFPLFLSPGNIPFMNDTMSKLGFFVTVGDREEHLEFDLNGLS
jgi:hypothetical protein